MRGRVRTEDERGLHAADAEQALFVRVADAVDCGCVATDETRGGGEVTVTELVGWRWSRVHLHVWYPCSVVCMHTPHCVVSVYLSLCPSSASGDNLSDRAFFILSRFLRDVAARQPRP